MSLKKVLSGIGVLVFFALSYFIYNHFFNNEYQIVVYSKADYEGYVYYTDLDGKSQKDFIRGTSDDVFKKEANNISRVELKQISALSTSFEAKLLRGSSVIAKEKSTTSYIVLIPNK